MAAARPTQPLRIALAIESSGPGGAENMVLALADQLRRAGHAPLIATLRPGWMTERAEAAGISVRIVPQRPGLDLAWIPRFASRLRRDGVQILHSHEFAMNIYGGAAALLARIPRVATVHGRHWVTDRPRRALAYRVLRRLGMPVVAVSHDLADFLATGLSIPREAIQVVHNGVAIPELPIFEAGPGEREAARARLGVSLEGPLLVAVGNLYPVKDHANLLRAAALLPGVRVAIAGRGEQEQPLRALAAELGIGERVHLLGLRDDVASVLRAGDLFVQPSRSEGLPLAILEAMAMGQPVVATRVGGVAEAVAEGETGYLVPPGDPEALAAALRKILEAPERRLPLGRAARERAHSEFSLETMADRYLALYQASASR